MNISELLTLARKIIEYTAPASAFSVGTSEHRLTCPTGKRYFIWGGQVTRDVSGTLNVHLHDSSDNQIMALTVEGAATDITQWPEDVLRPVGGFPLILDKNEYIKVLFGAAQGAGATFSAMYLEVDV